MNTTTTQASKTLTGSGRTELLERIDELEQKLAAVRAERDAYLENLTATQQRCTELLLALRATKLYDELGYVVDQELAVPLATLGGAIVRARTLHPNGCRYHALVEEVGEVARALRRETSEHVKEELLDTAVVAMRLFLGEWDNRPEQKAEVTS